MLSLYKVNLFRLVVWWNGNWCIANKIIFQDCRQDIIIGKGLKWVLTIYEMWRVANQKGRGHRLFVFWEGLGYKDVNFLKRWSRGGKQDDWFPLESNIVRTQTKHHQKHKDILIFNFVLFLIFHFIKQNIHKEAADKVISPTT